MISVRNSQVKTLERGSEQLQEISSSFGYLQDLEIVTVVESDTTEVPCLGQYLVSRHSTYLAFGSTLIGQDCISGFCSP